MTFFDKTGRKLANLEDWAQVFSDSDKEKHWKEGRSAYTLATYMLEENGAEEIQHIARVVLDKKVTLDKGIPELEVKFDDFGQGRVHDVGIWGHTEDNKTVFIGVEAKVDEPFGSTIAEEYLAAKVVELNGDKTHKIERIDNLLKQLIKTITRKTFELRYQLLHAAAGTLAATDKDGKKADFCIMLIIAFRTPCYDKQKGAQNYGDFLNFITTAKASHNIQCAYTHPLGFEEFSLHINNRDLEIVYVDEGFNDIGPAPARGRQNRKGVT